MFKKIIVMLIFCLCFSGALVATTYEASGQAYNFDNSKVFENFDPDGNVLSPVLEATRYQLGDVININFDVLSQHQKINHSYNTNGFNVISVNGSSTNTVNVKLSYITSFVDAEFKLNVNINNGDTIVANIYAFKTNYGIFISQNSLDDAKEHAYDYMIANGYMTLSDREAAWRANSQNNIMDTSPMFSPFANNITGTMTWRDDNNRTHPLQFIKIEFLNSSNTILETVFTNVNGNYSTNITPSGQVNVRIYPSGLNTSGTTSNVRVNRANGTEYFHEEVNISYSAAVSREFNTTGDLNRAFQVGQAAIVAARYARVMRGSFMSNVTVIYPHANTGCSYSPGTSTINITGNTAVSNNVRSYSSWDVIMHEYGHHVQHQTAFNIANNPAGSHNLVDNLADSRSSKDIGIRLAWAESWPTFFGSVAQQYFINLSELDSNIVSVGDGQYTSYNGASLNYANGTTVGGSTVYRNGEASESGVIGTLWALYTDTGKSWDNASLGHQAMWNLVTGNTMTTFSAFANAFYTTYPQYRSEFGQIMANFRITPSSVTNTAVTQSTPPTFSWIGNGGGSNTYTQNNRYTIVFYNNNTEIFRTSSITNTSTGTITHTLSTNDWNTVLSLAGSTIRVCIMAEQTSTPLTGGYFSQAISITTPQRFMFTAISGGNEYSISALPGYQYTGTINIPDSYLGKPVTQIAANGFANQFMCNEVVVPSSVTSIGYNAFGGCIGLTNIVIPSNVTSIGSNAFINCTGLIGINFPASVKSIGSSAFGNCIGLTNVTIPSTVTSVGSNAFSGCNNLSITWYYNPVFTAYGFKDYLTEVIFPSNLTSISNNAFKDCVKLSSITIPNSVTSIGYEAFRGCTSLTDIILPSGITYIAESTFWGCISITSIIVPENLETISDSAFYKCFSLTTINIPESVTSIGMGAFGECESLTSITIPSGVSNIKAETFYYCLNLENVVISLGVEYIEFNAFRYCTNLFKVNIPESVRYIGIQAFSHCTNLGWVYLQREAPDITLVDICAFDYSPVSIIVSKKNFLDYKTSPDLEHCRNRIICTTLTETGLDHYEFNNYTITKKINAGYNEPIVIHIMDNGTYRIESRSNSAIQMAIYDANMNLISTITYSDPNNTSGYIEHTFLSFYDMCYLVISFTDSLVSGTVETSFMWLN